MLENPRHLLVFLANEGSIGPDDSNFRPKQTGRDSEKTLMQAAEQARLNKLWQDLKAASFEVF